MNTGQGAQDARGDDRESREVDSQSRVSEGSMLDFHVSNPFRDTAFIHYPSRVNDMPVGGRDLAAGSISGSGSTSQSTPGKSPAPDPIPTTSTAPSEVNGLFTRAHNFTVQDSAFIEVHGNYNYTVNQTIYQNSASGHVAPNPGTSIEVAYKRCPPSTQLFTGRLSVLSDMETSFLNKVGARHVCVLYGLGGVGKTQIGYRFVERCSEKQRFSDVFFIDASTSDTIKTDLENISFAKGIGKSADDTLRWLGDRRQEWLIFFNNADDVQLNLGQFFPPCSHGNILVTTRNPQLSVLAPNASFKVTDLEEEEAINLLLMMVTRNKSATDATKAEVAAIVKELGCLPLAIVQAGAHIAKTQNLRGYLDLYRTNRARLWKAQPVQTHDDYRWTIYTTWDMSVNLLQPAASTFLRICSFMHHDGISEEMFKASSAAVSSCDEPEALTALTEFFSDFLTPDGDWDTFLFQEIVADVQSYSLINFDDANGVFYIHPLVHAWMYTMAEDDHSSRACTRYLVGLSVRQKFNPENRKSRRALQPHVDAILRDKPDMTRILLTNFSLVYQENGRYRDAERLRVQLVEKTRQLLGEEHLDTLKCIANLAATYLDLGRFTEAETLQVVVVNARKRLLDKEHPDVLDGIASLAATYWKQGRWDEAEELEVSVLETRKRLLGEDHPHVLDSAAELAASYRHKGRYDEAEKLLVAAVEGSKRVRGEDDPQTLSNIGNLAATYWKQGRFDEAEKLEVMVVERRKQVLGEDHPITVTSILNLAMTYVKQGRLKEAEKLQIAGVEARTRTLGEEHLSTLTSIANLASTYRRQGRFKEAENLILVVVEARKRLLGEEHPSTLHSIANLAVSHRGPGNFKEAEELEIRVMEVRKRVLGEEHPDTLNSIGNLVWTYRKQARFEEAEKLAVELTKTRTRVLGEEHPSTLTSVASLAAIYGGLGRFDDAEKFGVAVMEARKRVLGEEHPETLDSIAVLAEIHRNQGHLDKAEKLEVAVVEARMRLLGEDHPDTRTSIANLAKTRKKQTYIDEAERREEAAMSGTEGIHDGDTKSEGLPLTARIGTAGTYLLLSLLFAFFAFGITYVAR